MYFPYKYKLEERYKTVCYTQYVPFISLLNSATFCSQLSVAAVKTSRTDCGVLRTVNVGGNRQQLRRHTSGIFYGMSMTATCPLHELCSVHSIAIFLTSKQETKIRRTPYLCNWTLNCKIFRNLLCTDRKRSVQRCVSEMPKSGAVIISRYASGPVKETISHNNRPHSAQLSVGSR